MSRILSKSDIVYSVTRKTTCSRRQVEDIIDIVFAEIRKTLADGNRVKIPSFGVFETKERAPRVGRNPKANVPVKIPARRMPTFTPSEVFKDEVNISQKSL